MENKTFYDIVDKRINSLIKKFKNNTHLQKQDANGKKSFSFLLWFLERYLPQKKHYEFENFITEGTDDSSCDLMFTNQDQNGEEIFYVIQAKRFTKKKINSSNQIEKEIKACLNDFRTILKGEKKSNNNNFNKKYKELIKHKNNNGKIKFIFLTLCNNEKNIEEHIKDFTSTSPLILFDLIDIFKLKQQFIDMEYKGIKTHNPIETPYIPQSEFNIEIKKEQIISIKEPYLSYIFLIKPKEIYKLFEEYGHSLFYKNIRNPLPNSFFNEDIKESIKNNPINFWYFNNGITAITEKIYDFHSDSGKVKISGIQIINGAQTVFNIYETYKDADSAEKEKMNKEGLITLRIITTNNNDFDLKITRYTNSQNPINERDFHSNDIVQKRLQSDFLRHSNIWYETRRGEFRKKIKEITKLTNESLGQNYLAYFINDPYNAKQNKKLIFTSKELNSNGFYEKIFNDDTKYDNMLVAYYLKLFVEGKKKEINKEIKEINTTKKLREHEKELLKYDFIQYASFEIIALFKLLFFYNKDKKDEKAVNGKIISFFEKKEIAKIEKGYLFIRKFILKFLEKEETTSTRVNSVIFKNKNFYPSLKESFTKEMEDKKNEIKEFEI